MENLPSKRGFIDPTIEEIIQNATQRAIERGEYRYGFGFDVGEHCTPSEIETIARISANYRIRIATQKCKK